MKRCLILVLVLVLLAGCTPEEPVLPANIRIRSLGGPENFGGFTAGAPGDAEGAAKTLVESVLGEYPRSLLAQLGPVEVLLAGDLTGGGEFARGSYGGFTQRTDDGWRVVLDAEASNAGTVHHELAHILDGILTAAGRLPEAQWLRLCPSDFSYGSGDWEAYSDFFVDAYAMENIREDRAAVFEAAVLNGAGAFDGKSPLWLKLYTFSEAIRHHFDTEGWPDVAIWELALYGKV